MCYSQQLAPHRGKIDNLLGRISKKNVHAAENDRNVILDVQIMK